MPNDSLDNTEEINKSTNSPDRRKRINRMKTVIVVIAVFFLILPTVICTVLAIQYIQLQNQVEELVLLHVKDGYTLEGTKDLNLAYANIADSNQSGTSQSSEQQEEDALIRQDREQNQGNSLSQKNNKGTIFENISANENNISPNPNNNTNQDIVNSISTIPINSTNQDIGNSISTTPNNSTNQDIGNNINPTPKNSTNQDIGNSTNQDIGNNLSPTPNNDINQVIGNNLSPSSVNSPNTSLGNELSPTPTITVSPTPGSNLSPIPGQNIEQTESGQNAGQEAGIKTVNGHAVYTGKNQGIYSGKKVYLTFDDGPSIYTDEILDILAEYNVKATFFVVGKTDDTSLAQYKRIINEGHTLGMHSYSHKYDKIYNSVEDFDKDFTKLWKLLYDTTGYKPTIYRFPGGSDNGVNRNGMEDFIRYLNDKNIVYYDWNVLNGDATGVIYTVDQLIDNIIKDVAIKQRSIVLMHDVRSKKSTVESLPELLEQLVTGGAELLALDETVTPIQMIKADSVK